MHVFVSPTVWNLWCLLTIVNCPQVRSRMVALSLWVPLMDGYLFSMDPASCLFTAEDKLQLPITRLINNSNRWLTFSFTCQKKQWSVVLSFVCSNLKGIKNQLTFVISRVMYSAKDIQSDAINTSRQTVCRAGFKPSIVWNSDSFAFKAFENTHKGKNMFYLGCELLASNDSDLFAVVSIAFESMNWQSHQLIFNSSAAKLLVDSL